MRFDETESEMGAKFQLGDRVKIDLSEAIGNASRSHHGKKGTVVATGTDYNTVCIDAGLRIESFHNDELNLFVQPDVVRINTYSALLDLMALLGVRADWHEPDVQDVTVEVRGMSFDNAGSWGRDDVADKPHEELHVVLKVDDEPVAMVNLATLFAWATGYRG